MYIKEKNASKEAYKTCARQERNRIKTDERNRQYNEMHSCRNCGSELYFIGAGCQACGEGL